MTSSRGGIVPLSRPSKGGKRLRLVALSVVSVLALASSGMASAAAAPQDAKSAPAYIIAHPSVTVPSTASSTGVETFYPTGDVGPDTVIVLAETDGTLPGGLSEAEIANKIATGDTQFTGQTAAAPMKASSSTAWISGKCALGNTYTQTSPGISRDIGGAVTYTWWVTAGSATASMKGFYRGYFGSEMGVWQSWYGTGLASASDAALSTKVVPWDNVLALAEMRAQSPSCTLAALGAFRAA